jgi:hypothetical protein
MQAKEGLPCSSQSQVVATITYQSLFRLFYKLSGMTGTAMTDYKVRQERSIFFEPLDPVRPPDGRCGLSVRILFEKLSAFRYPDRPLCRFHSLPLWA